MSSELPKISIIVPVYNSAKTIRQCLNSLCDLDYPSYEIIVVDDGSTDNTARICRSYSQVTLILTPNGGPSRARNIGVQKATGHYVAFTDGDCTVHKRWLLELQKGFSEELVAGVGGNQISPPDETPFGINVQDTFALLGFATSYMKNPARTTQTSHNPSCNSAYRKTIFEMIEGFDESLWPGEDVDLDRKLIKRNFTLVRTPAAIVKHYRPQSFKALGSMMQRYGGSAFHLFSRHGFFRPLQYLPFITITCLTCLITGLVYHPHLAPFVLLPLPLLFPLVFIKNGNCRKTVILLTLSLHIYLHWHLGFLKAILTKYCDRN